MGDRIQLDDVDGTVESIGFRSTARAQLDGHLVSVPNKTMGNATITNVSKRPNIKTVDEYRRHLRHARRKRSRGRCKFSKRFSNRIR